MTLKLYWQHRWHLDLSCQNDALKFNTKYETASQVFDTTVNSQLNFEAPLWQIESQCQWCCQSNFKVIANFNYKFKWSLQKKMYV
jgi:hypothetical protein